MTLITRELTDNEQIIAFMASNVAAGMIRDSGGNNTPDVRFAVGTAMRIAEDLIARSDHDQYPGTQLAWGQLMIDEFAGQAWDGSNSRVGFSVEWSGSDQLKIPSLTFEQREELLSNITGTVESFVSRHNLALHPDLPPAPSGDN